MFTFIWSEGFGQGNVNPFLTMVNHSGETATAEIRMRLDNGGPMVTFHQDVQPWARAVLPLRDRVGGSNFWLSVKLNKPGAASLITWDAAYTIPPYAPPPFVVLG